MRRRFLKALLRIKQAAAEGHAGALRLLGDCHSIGHGATHSLRKAVELYTQAARKNDAEAQYMTSHDNLMLQ